MIKMNKPSISHCEEFHTVNWEILYKVLYIIVLLMKVAFFLKSRLNYKLPVQFNTVLL